ncbi:DUF2971 domain-containing protein [Pedobacter gandavensis]|uniref:DUF2971 domain-containing protein n=1 Tax=Pedobacter gandavensis TaxID=2679963 RepID=UPI00292CD1A1|nr:DUF2971 domain-containing protein [Pedobacter gandavensis]
MEYQYGLNLFTQALKEFEDKNGFVEKFDTSLVNRFTFLNKLYTISFCENRDDLNLWRGYCPKEGGIAIGFDKSTLFPDKDVIVNKCQYGNPYKGIIGDSNYQRIKSKFKNIEGLYKDREHIQFTYDLAHIKSEGFIGENEWRGVSFGTNQKIDYYVKNSMIVPFYDQSFNKKSIKQILIGPTVHQDKIKEALEIMTKQHNITCEISKSAISFVQY